MGTKRVLRLDFIPLFDRAESHLKLIRINVFSKRHLLDAVNVRSHRDDRCSLTVGNHHVKRKHRLNYNEEHM